MHNPSLSISRESHSVSDLRRSVSWSCLFSKRQDQKTCELCSCVHFKDEKTEVALNALNYFSRNGWKKIVKLIKYFPHSNETRWADLLLRSPVCISFITVGSETSQCWKGFRRPQWESGYRNCRLSYLTGLFWRSQIHPVFFLSQAWRKAGHGFCLQ